VASLKDLEPYGLKYQWNVYTADDEPGNAILAELAEKRQDSVWGQRGFVAQMRKGWNGECDGFPGWVEPVTQRGERFLREHGEAPVLLDVVLELARAYETWWSLSKPDSHFAEESGQHVDAAAGERARLRAIELYRVYQRARPAAGITRRLTYLERDIDTRQLAYYCYAD